jgi:hypothetical protein
MSSDLMTIAICWELGEKVSVEYANSNSTLYYFCPEPECLERVAPVQGKINIFFRALNRHVTGCRHEKETTESSGAPGKPKKFTTAVPPTTVPTHLGIIPVSSRKTDPDPTQLLRLSQQVRTSPVTHPGTFQEVVDAWQTMSTGERNQHQLTIANQTSSYANAFTSLIHTGGGNLSAVNNSSIAWGPASVKLYGGSFFIQTFNKLNDGINRARIRIIVRPGQAYFSQLTHDTNINLFLHTTPTINNKGDYFEIPPSTPYSGFIIK